MSAEYIEDSLPQVWSVICQVKKLIGSTESHGIRLVTQVCNSASQAFLALSLFSVLVGPSLFGCSLGLVPCYVLRDPDLEYDQNAAHAETQELKDSVFDKDIGFHIVAFFQPQQAANLIFGTV